MPLPLEAEYASVQQRQEPIAARLEANVDLEAGLRGDLGFEGTIGAEIGIKVRAVKGQIALSSE